MTSARTKRWIAGLAFMVVLAAGSGCNLPNLANQALSFALGTLFASQFRTTSVEYRCFRDGVEVDCSELGTFPP